MIIHSFIWQQYEYRFRNREQTLFEDILADEYIAAIATLTVLGRKRGRANCAKALEQAIEETVHRLSQKQTQNKLIDTLYNFFQEEKTKTKQKQPLLEKREELILKLLTFLPKNIILDIG
jgi:ribonuclease HII